MGRGPSGAQWALRRETLQRVSVPVIRAAVPDSWPQLELGSSLPQLLKMDSVFKRWLPQRENLLSALSFPGRHFEGVGSP